MKLKAVEEEEEKSSKTEFKPPYLQEQKAADNSADAEQEEELEQIRQHEKTVNIRFAQFSMLVRAGQYGISSRLL